MAHGTFFRSPRAAEARAGDPRASNIGASNIGGSNPHASDAPADCAGPASDPRLVELARLIGQSDPFASGAQRGGAARRGSFDAPKAGPPPPRAVRDQRTYDAQPEAPHQAPENDEADAGGDEVDEHAAPRAAHYGAAHGAGDYSGEDAEADTHEQGEYDYEGGLGDDYEDDGPSASKPRKTIKVVAAAVLGLAVFGSAAALGYHTIFKGGLPGPPPVIRADNSPTKVVPASVPGESSTKINERLGDGSQGRLVRREEDPVDLRDPARGLNAAPGMALAGVGGPAPAASAPAASGPATAPSATPPGGLPDEPPPPKRVRTVSIRVDQGAPAAERATAPPSRVASAPRVTASAPQPPPAPGGAPLALTPQAVGAAPQTAALEPPKSASAGARAPRSADSGSFVVQLLAQKSESEAQTAFRSMQTRYAVLNGRQPLIRRKDQGDRGVVYAAQVGPFVTRDEANQLCESLKMAGGTCFVQKN